MRRSRRARGGCAYRPSVLSARNGLVGQAARGAHAVGGAHGVRGTPAVALARAAAALALVAIALGGCSAPHSGAVANTGPCAQVLPLAHATVGGHGRLLTVKVVKRSSVRKLLMRASRPAHRPHARLRRKVCLVVYRGPYRAGAVPAAGPTAAGRYAVLAIRVRHPELVRAAVIDRVPRALLRRP